MRLVSRVGRGAQAFGRDSALAKGAAVFSRRPALMHMGCQTPSAGVRDDNGARDAVVKGFLKNADSIWIVSHIGRAVNDKTAKVSPCWQAGPGRVGRDGGQASTQVGSAETSPVTYHARVVLCGHGL